MAAIVAAILYNFRNLAHFAGRDMRAQFWPYAIFLFIVQSIINLAIMIPFMVGMMSKMFQFIAQQVAKPGPLGRVDQQAMNQMMQSIFSDFGSVLMITGPIVMLIFVVLIAAAVSRRLHDCNRTGYWGLVPLPFTIVGFALMPRMFATWPVSPDFGQFGVLLANNLFYFAAVILLIVLLAQRSSAGANRFGPEVTDWRYSP